MLKATELKTEKLILLFILLLASIFMLGCSSSGKEDEEVVYTQFCAGKYYPNGSASVGQDLVYASINQREGRGSINESDGNKPVMGSDFRPTLNVSNDGTIISDGFANSGSDKERYKEGNYTFVYSSSKGEGARSKKLDWNDMPVWKTIPSKVAYDEFSKQIMASNPGVEKLEANKDYTYKYRVKVYVYDKDAVSTQLFTQSETFDETQITCTLPRSLRTMKLIPMLVCEMRNKSGELEKIIYYEGESFTY